MSMMKVGDKVMWRGCFGMDPAKPAVIESIEQTEQRRSKYGEPVNEIAWKRKDYALVTLDNGHWAYGEQLSPMPA
jgi:hypothetical protein